MNSLYCHNATLQIPIAGANTDGRVITTWEDTYEINVRFIQKTPHKQNVDSGLRTIQNSTTVYISSEYLQNFVGNPRVRLKVSGGEWDGTYESSSPAAAIMGYRGIHHLEMEVWRVMEG